jgi:hypothetical protein
LYNLSVEELHSEQRYPGRENDCRWAVSSLDIAGTSFYIYTGRVLREVLYLVQISSALFSRDWSREPTLWRESRTPKENKSGKEKQKDNKRRRGRRKE